MKFGLLGYYPEFDHRDMEIIDFSSDKTILEYDILLVDLENIFSSFKSYEEYNGFPRITDHDSMQLKIHLKKRKAEIKEFLESGKNVIVLGGNDDCVYCYTGKKDTSGTGRNAKTTYYVEDVHSVSLLPIKISPLSLSGKRISYKNKSIQETFKKYNDYFEYRTVYEGVNDNILMTIENTGKVLAYYEQVGKGKILFLPDLRFDRKNPTIESRLERKYFNDLSNISGLLLNKEVELPIYSKNYLLPNEEIMISDINKSKEQLSKLLEDIDNKEQALLELQKQKIMFTGTGTQLEINSVEQFKGIGFSIIKYNPDSVDEDIVIKFEDKIAVVEVKGISGSATEKHTSQIVKWKSEYHIENDVIPKGILLVNAFNDKELDSRQDYFPNQMLKYATHQEICLLTTIQLYNIKKYLEKKPEEREKIINEIYTTNGLYKNFGEWNLNIKKNEMVNK
jgi:hypothetical protein